MVYKICAISGSRADWGLLSSLLKEIQACDEFDLKIVITGQHLSETKDTSIKAIEDAGFTIDDQIDIQLASDNRVATAKSMGLGVIGFSDCYNRLKPDYILALGDRFEMLAAVQTALVMRIPVIHLYGGDVTEGAMDDAIRHSISKMSHVHFVTTKDAKKRLEFMGEDPSYVHEVGAPGLDLISQTTFIEKDELVQDIGLRNYERNFMITYHPVTLDENSLKDVQELLDALSTFGPDTGLIFTGSNVDPGGFGIGKLIQDYVQSHENAVFHASLGSRRYLSALNFVDCVIGNSSSGIYEVPSFKKPTINIGDRQKGRCQAASIINCNAQKDAIVSAIEKGLEMDCSQVINPYGDGKSSQRIISVLKSLPAPEEIVKKKFFDCF